MKTIWKYRLPWEQFATAFSIGERAVKVDMPMGARIVHFAVQNGVPSFWAIVDDTHDTEQRYFQVVGTGHALPGDEFDFVATTISDPHVWHLFERLLVPISS